MSRKRRIISAPDRIRHQALLAPWRPQHPFTPLLRYPRSVLDGMTFSHQLGCGEAAIDRYTYGVNDSPVPLLLDDSPVILPPKQNAAALSSALTRASPQSNARLVSKNGQVRRRLIDPPGSNTRFCPDFVSMTLSQKAAC